MATQKMKRRKMSTPKATRHIAKRSLKTLSFLKLKQLMARTKKRISFVFGNEEYQIPKREQRLLIEALLEMKDHKNTQKIGATLSTQEVADLLNVSCPFVVKLIETHQLRSFKAGSHRRVLKVDALAFQQKMRNEKNAALNALAEVTGYLGLIFK